MIQASELRIGNLLQFEPFNNTRLGLYSDGVTEITAKGLFRIAMGGIVGSGIPLTEEWLLKLGFEASRLHIKNYFNPKTMKFELRNVAVLDNEFKIIAGYPESIYFKCISDELKSVHQLQNLYFALTGKELTIK